MFARELHRPDLAFGTTFAKTAGHKDSVDAVQMLDGVFGVEQFRGNPVEIDPRMIGNPAMNQRLGERFVGVGKIGVLAHNRDVDLAVGGANAADDLAPRIEIGRGARVDLEMVEDLNIEAFVVILDRHLIDRIDIKRGHDGFRADIAEQCDLVAFAVRNRAVTAAQEHMRPDTDPLQFHHRMLGRLGLELAGCGQIRHQRQMYEHCPLGAQFIAQLANGLEKRQAFDIADRAADFTDHEILAMEVGRDEFLDGVGDVGNDLNRATQIVSTTLATENVGINPSGRDVIRLGCRDPREPFVMSQIEIGFGPVVGDVDLAMLKGAHRARINIQIRVQLTDTHTVTTCLEQCPQSRRSKPLTQRGNDTTRDENKPCRHVYLVLN